MGLILELKGATSPDLTHNQSYGKIAAKSLLRRIVALRRASKRMVSTFLKKPYRVPFTVPYHRGTFLGKNLPLLENL